MQRDKKRHKVVLTSVVVVCLIFGGLFYYYQGRQKDLPHTVDFRKTKNEIAESVASSVDAVITVSTSSEFINNIFEQYTE